MKRLNVTKIWISKVIAKGGMTTAVLTAAMLFVGCRSTGYVKSDAMAWKLQATAGQVRAENRTLEATMSALNDLVTAPSGDLRVQFNRFSQALDQLVASSKKAQSTTGSLERRRAAYFAAWDKQLLAIAAEDLRKQSETRRTEVSSQYDATYRRFEESQDALAPLVDYLQDTRKALSADLTVAGLEVIKPSAASSKEKAAHVQAQLSQAAADLDALGARMSSYAPQERK